MLIWLYCDLLTLWSAPREPATGKGADCRGIGGSAHNLHNLTSPAPMTRIKRPSPTHAWLDGYRPQPTLEAACQALEARLNEGRPPLFADAPRVHMEADWWSD